MLLSRGLLTLLRSNHRACRLRGAAAASACSPREAVGAPLPGRRCYSVPALAASSHSSHAHDRQPTSIQSHSRNAHAVISTFDLFSVGVGPSSSHTVGPWRAAGIFVGELEKAKVLDKVATLKITLYGSLAATGKGHATVEAILMGAQGYDCETVDTSIVRPNFQSIIDTKTLALAGTQKINFDVEKDIRWRWDSVLPEHPNGMSFAVFDSAGEPVALNEYFSVGGGFVVTPRSLRVGGENVFYKQTNADAADPARRQQDHGVPEITSTLSLPATADSSKAGNSPNAGEGESAESSKWALPPMPFASGKDLLDMCAKYNLTIAQVVWENERHYLTDEEIKTKTLRLWKVMDACIREGVSHPDSHLPGILNIRRRAPGLYKRLMRGFYPSIPSTEDHGHAAPLSASATSPEAAMSTGERVQAAALSLNSAGSRKVRGRLEHPLPPVEPRKTVFPAMDFLSAYAIAVNEVNASGGRIVTAPTNGASGIIPSVAKYVMEFISQDPERDIITFLLTSAAVGMLFKRGATISAAEGGCMAEVGVACSMAAAGFVACMGGTPAQILQAAEIGIEHNLGLTCDPVEGLVIAPCVERNALGAVKAVTAAQLALSGDGSHFISFDEALQAMRDTAQMMHSNYKETSLGGLATAVKISVSVPNC